MDNMVSRRGGDIYVYWIWGPGRLKGGDVTDIKKAWMKLTRVVWDRREQRRLTMEWGAWAFDSYPRHMAI